jgi:t-SNARE complex subunit (syntaxin)
MEYYNKDAIEQIRRNLDKIPKNIDSKILIKDIIKEMENNLKSEIRRRVSYV